MTLWNDARLLIDGELVEATGGRRFENLNPATEEVLGEVPDASTQDAERAIAAARRTFDTTDWSRDHAFRSRCLRQLRDGLLARLEELREVTVAEVGCPISMTYGAALDDPVNWLGHYADFGRQAPALDRARADGRGGRDYALERPERHQPEEDGLGTGGGLHGRAQGGTDDLLVRQLPG
jgi:acyl-CoA reductase-like NAD-dependent aldehyde dehydrogenase